ncbi:MAG: tRNA glutamyl-Q(34) synthetase GluQRS [Phycisphaerales bacterium]|nr:tRNA glutamyl-Q(34) synthetase GluQRS [Phycisphaerales bacterium]
MSPPVTRLAPSPTGALHLGNARTFLVNWAMARRSGWRIVLRIEDLDGPRVKPGAIEGVISTLRWLGMDWDEGPIVQSADLSPYEDAMRALARGAMAYPCELTRGQIEAAASAPHEAPAEGEDRSAPGQESRFPSSLRPALWARGFDRLDTNWRFATPGGEVSFVDGFAGAQRRSPAESIGDFVVWTKRGQPAYQLAVVVDDHRQGVTHVVRGDDLLDSAARQLLLHRALGLAPEPAYFHLPLVVGPDGRRLAKRHGDTRIDRFRAEGAAPERVVAIIARWCGLGVAGRMSGAEFAARLEPASIPRRPIVCTPEDHAWLLRDD